MFNKAILDSKCTVTISGSIKIHMDKLSININNEYILFYKW